MAELQDGATAARQNTASRLARLRRSSTYDLVMRLPVLLWSSTLAFSSAAALQKFAQVADPPLPPVAYWVGVAMRLSVIAFLVILATAVIVRKAPTARARGVEPRVSALIGTFLITGIVLCPRRELSLPLGIVSTLVSLTGDALAIVILVQLRRSFSIMPEARELVTSGLYRLVRHPLYLAEEIAAIGTAMQFFSIGAVMLLLTHFAFQLRRICHEETVLTAAFPRYAAYAETTARIIPGFY